MKTLDQYRSTTHSQPRRDAILHWCSSAALGLGLLFTSVPSTSAQTTNAYGWELQSGVLSVDGLNTTPSAAVCSSSGAVYLTGQMWSGQLYDTTKGVVLKSVDRGNSWEDLVFTPPSGTTIHDFPSIAVASVPQADGSMQEQVFAIGTASDPATYEHAPRGIYRHRPNATPTWDQITGAIPGQSSTGMAVDNAGNVYVVGTAYETVKTAKGTTTYGHGVLWRGTRDLASDTYTFGTPVCDFGRYSTADALVCVGSSVFVAGSLNSAWEVRKCTANIDGSMTVTPIDRQFRLSSGDTARANRIVADGAGNLVVVGSSGGKSSGGTVIRKGSANGPFTTIGTISGLNFNFKGVTVDNAGLVHVIAWIRGTKTTPYQPWVIRQGREINGAWSWVQSDDGSKSATTSGGYAPQAHAITSDAVGNVYAFGLWVKGEEERTVLRRRLAENAPAQ